MTYYSRTQTLTSTYTYVDVRHVNWKIRSDLRYIRVLFGLFSEQYEEEMSGDLYQWVLAGYASQIKFLIYTGQDLKLGLRYQINSSGIVSRDDDAGNIPYVNLSLDARFDVLVVPSSKWRIQTQTQKENFYARLVARWGDSNLYLSERGTWSSDNVYSSNKLSAQRDIFKSL